MAGAKEFIRTSSEITEREQLSPGIRSSIDPGTTRSRPGPKANRREHRAHTLGRDRLLMKRNKPLERVSILRSVEVEF